MRARVADDGEAQLARAVDEGHRLAVVVNHVKRVADARRTAVVQGADSVSSTSDARQRVLIGVVVRRTHRRATHRTEAGEELRELGVAQAGRLVEDPAAPEVRGRVPVVAGKDGAVSGVQVIDREAAGRGRSGKNLTAARIRFRHKQI